MTSSNPLAQIWREMEGLKRLVAEVRSSMGVFENVTVGKGGIDLKEGGQFRLYDSTDTLAMTLGSGILDILNAGRLYLSDESGERVIGMGSGILDLIDPATSGRMRLQRGRIYLYDSTNAGGQPGVIAVDQGAGTNYLRLFPPSSSGSGLENSITVRGRTPGQSGQVWVYSDGGFVLDVDQGAYIGSDSGQVYIGAPDVFLDGNQVNLNTGGNLRLYELPTTSSSANLRLLEGGDPRVAWVTSSRRFKQDIEDFAPPAADVLRLRPRTWRDKSEVEDDPNTTSRNAGFVAEEVAEIESLRYLLVNADPDGEPQTLNYDRFPAAQQVVLQDHEQRIVDLEAENAGLKEQVAALAARLDALEGK